jgi:ring-1,2-phenylacetyl-CoA epoxidase subunit PaaD
MRRDEAWSVLAGITDPELPWVTLCDLGIVREFIEREAGFEVVLTPTYSGCPATEVIAHSVCEALDDAGFGPVTVTQRLAPAWTTDWISDAGRIKLRAAGIAPPGRLSAAGPVQAAGAGPSGTVATAGPAPAAGIARPAALADAVPPQAAETIRIRPRNIACPRCGSLHTERLSAFGSTACKALHRCLDCREPFEHFKPL